jgi:uncharacterized membrane protein YtjA (UPF0391 family)
MKTLFYSPGALETVIFMEQRYAADVLPPSKQGEPTMLYYALVFLVVALIAGVLGFGGIAGASAGIAKILFGIFIILFLISLAMRLFRQA